MRKIFAAALAAAVLAGAGAAQAADSYGKWVSGEVSFEIQNDHVYEAEDGSEANDLYATFEAVGRLHLTDRLSLEAGLTFEPVQDPVPGEDRWFDDHGLYVDTIQLMYEGEDWFVHGGKFAAAFGIDPDLVPGLYGDTFSGGYELTERVGFGAGYAWEIPEVAALEVKAAVFRADVSSLSRSAITSRGRLRNADGGIGNTDGLENYSLAVDVTEIAALPGLALRASLLHQGRGAGDPESQWATSLGGVYEIAVGDDLTVAPMIDWVHAEGAGFATVASSDDASEDIVTAGLGLGWGNWGAAVTGGLQSGEQPGSPDVHDRFIQVSLGYAFEAGIGVEVGWLHLDQDDVTVDSVGAKLSYGLEF